MNTLRPFGVTLRPKPGCPASQYTMSDFGVGSVSIALLVSRMRGMEGGTCREALPSLRIGSTANEMTGPNVIFRPHSRKKNQRVMNRQPSTSISGKHRPENARGAGIIMTTALWPQAPSIHRRRRSQLLHLLVGRQHAPPVDIFEVGHRPLAVLQRDLADIGAHRRLMVVGAEFERPQRTFDLEPAERDNELVGIGRARLGDAGGERIDGVVADYRTQAGIVVP